MKPTRIDQILMTLDKAVNWTGISDRIKAETMHEGAYPRSRLLRWAPLCPIACCAALFSASLAWPSVFEISMGAVVVAGMVPFI
jgi:hypothetical protein